MCGVENAYGSFGIPGSMHKSDIEAQVDAYTRGYALDAEEREIIRYFLNLNIMKMLENAISL